MKPPAQPRTRLRRAVIPLLLIMAARFTFCPHSNINASIR